VTSAIKYKIKMPHAVSVYVRCHIWPLASHITGEQTDITVRLTCHLSPFQYPLIAGGAGITIRSVI
jgi:hypothetical protein